MDGFRKIECCDCGVLFSVSSNLDVKWRETQKRFYCPNGHSQSYTKSTANYLKEEIDEKNKKIFSLEKEVRILTIKKKPKAKKKS